MRVQMEEELARQPVQEPVWVRLQVQMEEELAQQSAQARERALVPVQVLQEEPVQAREQQATPRQELQLLQAAHWEGLPVLQGEPREPREPVQGAVRLAPSYRVSCEPIPQRVEERAQEGAL